MSVQPAQFSFQKLLKKFHSSAAIQCATFLLISRTMIYITGRSYVGNLFPDYDRTRDKIVKCSGASRAHSRRVPSCAVKTQSCSCDVLQWDNGSTQQHQYSHCSRILSVALIVDQNLEIIQRMLLIVEPRLRYIEYSAPCDLSDRYISSHYSEHPAVLFSKISPPRFLVARTRFSLKLLLTLIN